MTGKSIKVLAALLLFLAAGSAALVFAQNSGAEPEEINGNYVVSYGKPGQLTGTLKEEDGEWFLVDGEKVYALHLGMLGHDEVTTAGMKEGAEASIRGFIYGSDVSPMVIVSEGKTYTFRAEDGRPLWSGRWNNSASARRVIPQSGQRPLWGRNSGT